MIEIMLWVLAFMLVWTAGAVWWFIRDFGNKHKPKGDPWYIWVLGAPLLPIAMIFGLIERYRQYKRRKNRAKVSE